MCNNRVSLPPPPPPHPKKHIFMPRFEYDNQIFIYFNIILLFFRIICRSI